MTKTLKANTLYQYDKEFEMKKTTFISLLSVILCAATPYTSVTALEPDLDLQTLIAGIKHFDAAVTSGEGELVYNHHLGTYEEERIYTFTFDGAIFEEAQVRVDYHSNSLGSFVAEIYDGERQWEIYEQKEPFFSVDISPADHERLNKAKLELPPAVKQQFKAHGIRFSGDFRIETEIATSYLKMIDNVTRHSYYIYYTDEYFSVYTPRLEYGLRSRCVIHAHLDPRYWMTYGKATPNSYLMTLLWKVLEDYESEILQVEMLNGEETYLVNIKHPRTESLKLWISPEKGFRLVKLQKISIRKDDLGERSVFKKGKHYMTERVLYYQEYLPGIWFPEKVEETTYPLLAVDPQKKGNRIGKTTLQIITCELNADVSERFQLDIVEETPVYDNRLRKSLPYRELKQTSQ